MRETCFIVLYADLEAPKGGGPEAFAGDRVGAMVFVQTLQIRLARHLLNGADEQPLQPGIFTRGIGKIVGFFRRHRYTKAAKARAAQPASSRSPPIGVSSTRAFERASTMK